MWSLELDEVPCIYPRNRELGRPETGSLETVSSSGESGANPISWAVITPLPAPSDAVPGRQLPLYVLGLNPRDDRHGEMGEPVEDAEQVIVPRASQDLRIGVAAL